MTGMNRLTLIQKTKLCTLKKLVRSSWAFSVIANRPTIFQTRILVSYTLLAAFSLNPIGSHANTLSLITNNGNAENHTLARRTLRAMYSMRTQSWPNGEHLTVFVLPDDQRVHEDFCQRILGVLPYQLRRSWDRLVFSGKAAGPIRVQSLEEMKARVSNTPGAIGYIPEKHIDDTILVVEVK